jgi:hypothetical protein
VPAFPHKEIHVLFPTTHPDSVPFLLVRPVSVSEGLVAATKPDAGDDDAETAEIPASKSVPPHSPPPPVVTTEHELPSVIVELHELEVSEMIELQRASDVDVLLTASETIEFPLDVEFPVHVEEAPALDGRAKTRRSAMKSSGARTAWARGFAIATIAALTAAGGTFAGLRVCHGAAGTAGWGSLGASLQTLHIVR